MRETKPENGYVECHECGQAIERHTRTGYGDCREPWTVREIRAVRQRAGLPMHFRREDY